MNHPLLRQYISKDSNFYTEGFDFIFDKFIIPSVHVERDDKHIICVSCMKGCPIGCIFCASGENFFGTLNKTQIYTMVSEILKFISNDKKEILLSFMGAGEPLLNTLNVVESIDMIKDKVDRIAISTSGVGISNLHKFDLDNIKIQLSVHSVNNLQRKKIMSGIELEKIMEEISILDIKKIDYNFSFIEHLNDNIETCNEIVDWCNKWGIKRIKVNKFHSQMGLKESYKKRYIVDIIKQSGIDVEEYETDGEDINVSCGQMKIRGI